MEGDNLQIIEQAIQRMNELLEQLDDLATIVRHQNELPEEIRKKLMLLASSPHDLLFWIRQDPEEIDVEWYELQEVESGVTLHAVSPREVCDDYFRTENVV